MAQSGDVVYVTESGRGSDGDGHLRAGLACGPGRAAGLLALTPSFPARSAWDNRELPAMTKPPAEPVAIEGTDEESRGMIHSLLQGMCRDGDGCEFAAALARGTGLPIVGLLRGACGDGGVPGAWRHAAVMLPDGSLFDVRGRVPAEEFGTPFGETWPWLVLRMSEADLAAVRPLQEANMHTIAKLAQALWPDLPWLETSFHGRMAAFLADLDALSRKHQVWIRAPYPAASPMLAEGNGDEAGYRAGVTCDGLAISFDRSFRR